MFETFDQRRYLIPFRSLLLPHIFTDTLIIGAGVAGMAAAFEAASRGDVIVIHKESLDLSNTAWAQGGVAAAMREPDLVSSHIEDTLRTGDGHCSAEAVDVVCREAPEAMEQLIRWGMEFDRAGDGSIELGREGGHSHHRILHAGGAATGVELVRCMGALLQSRETIRQFDGCFALDLLTAPGGGDGGSRVLGAITHHPRYGLQIIWARSTILACGGAGQVYRETTNPRVATGDGVALAYRAGAEIADIEFMQFHPTTLYVAGSSRSLISEAVRGEGAHLVDREGRRFMPEYHDMAELAPRDVVSRAIIDQLRRGRGPSVFLDVRHLPRGQFAQRFPGLASTLRSFDLNPDTDLIPVNPSAHYTIGGVWTDLDGRTTLDGLFACGEAACNGLHGANRLASNSLLEGLVFGRRAGQAAASDGTAQGGPIQIISDIHETDHAELDISDVRSSLRSAMWRNVGIERQGSRMADVAEMCSFWARYTLTGIFDDPAGWETQNLLTVGALLTRAALWRAESRGVHYRLDQPEHRAEFSVRGLWKAGRSEPRLHPVEQPGVHTSVSAQQEE